APHVTGAGNVWGWVALAAAVAAVVWHAGQMLASASVHVLGGLGLAVSVLAASTAAHWDGGNWLAYHVLTAGCAVLGATALATGRASRHRENLARLFPRELVQGWVAGLGVLVLGLALRGVVDDPAAPWWPATMAVAVGALWAGLALWQRQEGWAIAAGLCINLAVTLVLGYGHSAEELLAGWVPLVQANVITSSAIALLWLTTGRRLFGRHWPQLVRTPGLSGQVALGLAGNLLLLIHPAILLILQPPELPETVRQGGTAAGWLALIAAVVPAAWYAGRRLLHRAVPILSGLGVAMGILVACTAARWDTRDWLAYHVLTAAWCAVGAATLLGAWQSLRRTEKETATFPLVASVVAVGGLVFGLALRAIVEDPLAPWWSAGPVLFVAVLAAGLALWRGRETWAFVGSVLVLLAVSLVV